MRSGSSVTMKGGRVWAAAVSAKKPNCNSSQPANVVRLAFFIYASSFTVPTSCAMFARPCSSQYAASPAAILRDALGS